MAQAVLKASRSAQPDLLPVDRSEPLPLSWAQQRLWFLDQLDHAAGAAYHLPAGLRLQGRLDRGALQATLDAIVGRHEVLRTSFVVVDEQPVQQIAPAEVGFRLIEHDLSGLPATVQQARVSELSQREAAELFDLSAGPLVRGQLLRLAPEDHLLLITQHHIISDGRSTGVLLREVVTLYGALSQGRPDPLPALGIQYADYAVWQRQWLQEEVLQGQVDFWKSHLAGAPAVLELPSDRLRPAVQGHAGSSVGLTLPAKLTAGLRQLSQRHGVTLFMTLFAGWSAFLYRLTGQSDLVIGVPVANRQRSELESLIGLFVNTLALRVRLEEDPRVAELLAQIKASTLEAYAHQDIPFAQVVEALQPSRSVSYNPMFQVMLALDDAPGERALSLPGLTVSEFELTQSTAQLDLILSLRDGGESIAGLLEYATDLFDRSTIERMGAHLLSLLEAMVADDQQRISELNLLSQAQRQQLLVGFNETQRPYPSERLIHQLIEEQVDRRPDAVAAVFEDRQLSYGELNARANQLAHHLIGLGIRPDDRVAICMERSLEMVVGVLGILKAGGAYVPLDPSYPAQRLAYMLEDSAAVTLVTQAAVREGLPALDVPVVVLELQDRASMIAQEAQYNPDATALGLTPQHLAYVIYTSGSTGSPKGVMVEHQGVVNYLWWAIKTYAPTEGAVVSSPLSFDATATSLYGPLLCGGEIRLLRERDEIEGLNTRIHRAQVCGLVKITPSHLEMQGHRMQSGGGKSSVSVFVVGGEPLSISTVRLWRQIQPDVRLVNEYGPTETVVGCVAYDIPRHWNLPESVPIGRPIANTQIYILDPHGQPVPVGVNGEIYIGGAGVARGYLNRPELTAERFLKDPFSRVKDARMYKTGDLGRWLADGNIEYLGRNDFQVKIRGFRIELGEIEAQLAACSGVREAVVIAREDSPGDKRLVAYLTAQGGAELSAAELRGQLSRVLAEYMVPAAYVQLESLPLTANGKLDRKALPMSDQSSLVSRDYEPPVGKKEVAIAQIWQAVLGLPRVGRHDNFFELGGHSLLVLKVLAAIRAEFGRPIPMVWVFQAPTPIQLAALIDHNRNDHAWKHLVALNEGGSRPPLFCLNGFEGDLHDYLHIARFVDPSVPVYGLQVGSAAVGGNFHESPDTRMEAYQQEIRSVQASGPYRLCGFSFGGSEAFDLAKRFEDAGEEVVLILLDAYRPSKWLTALSWLPRMVYMLQAHRVISTANRKLRNLFTYEVHHWLTGKDKDLKHALLRRSMKRKYMPLSGRVILFTSTMSEYWAFPLQLDGHNGWKKYVHGRFDVVHMECGHLALIKEPIVKSVAKHLNEILCD